MAKQDKPELSDMEKATAELRQAEKAYGELVGQDVSKMKMGEIDKHQQACRDALEAKRAAQKAVEDIRLGRA